MAIYKVDMTFLAEQDDFNSGLTGKYGSQWHETEEFETLAQVKKFVKDRVYSGYEYIEYDSYLKQYTTSYLTTDDNGGELSLEESKAWKRGEMNAWAVTCGITVLKFTPKIIGNVKFN